MSLIKMNNTSRIQKDRDISIRLCMIVKNEESIIVRCLASVYDLIDSWFILDTGSTDKTVELINRFMKDKPGECFQTDWTDFSTARNQAFENAISMGECDYLLIIDADEVAEMKKMDIDYMINRDMADVYLVDVQTKTETNPRVFLVKSDYKGRWKGEIHEDLEVMGKWMRFGVVKVVSYDDGARFKSKTRVNDDLSLLFKAIQRDAMNPRNYYYLGMTYLHAGVVDQAEKAFLLRMKFGGDANEKDKARGYLEQIKRSRESV
jgi:glycosyltransferase involved in cell wall biosynthesis